MARITWDNVVAPDFRSSMEGFKNASDMLSGAFGSARAGLKDFDKTRRERVNNVIAERMSKITSDEEMQEALKTGELFGGVNRDLVSTEMYGAAMDRPGALLRDQSTRLNNDSKAENNRFTEWGNEVTQTDRANSIAFAPALTEFAQVFESGTKEEKAAARSRLMAKGAELGMTTDQIAQAVRTGDGFRRTDREFRDSDLGYEENKWGFDNDVEDREIDEFVNDTIGQLELENLTVEEAAESLRNMKDIPGRVRRRIAQGLNIPGLMDVEDIAAFGSEGGGGSIANAVASSQALGSSGAVFDAPQSEVATVLEQGGASSAAIAGILGNFHVEGGYTGGRGDGGSADGIAQWRLERREAFRNKYGKDPSKASYTQQAEFVLWELQTPEGRKVAGISKANADKILNATDPAEAARLFDKYYERSDGKHRNRRVAAAQDYATSFRATERPAQRARATAVNQTTAGNNVLDNVAANQGKQISVSQAAAGLLELPEFKESGYTKERMEGLIESVISQAAQLSRETGNVDSQGNPNNPINEAQAAEIIKESWGSSELLNSIQNSFGFGNPQRGGYFGGRGIQDDKVRSNIMRVITGDTERALNRRDAVGMAQEDDEAVQAQVSRMQAQAAYARRRGMPERAAQIEAEIQALMGGQVARRGQEPREGLAQGPGSRTPVSNRGAGFVRRVRLPELQTRGR